MPSHIYSMLGMWQDVIAADRAAEPPRLPIQALLSRGRGQSGAFSGRYHSLDFLTHAHLQLAQDRGRSGFRIHSEMGEYPARSRYTGHTAFAAIPVRYAFERGAWAEAAASR